MLPALRRVTSSSSSFRPFLKRPFKSSTTQRRSRLQHGYCIGVSRRSARATAGKGLAQGPYMAARAGVEPRTLRLRGIASTNAPPCPTVVAATAAAIAAAIHVAIVLPDLVLLAVVVIVVKTCPLLSSHQNIYVITRRILKTRNLSESAESKFNLECKHYPHSLPNIRRRSVASFHRRRTNHMDD